MNSVSLRQSDLRLVSITNNNHEGISGSKLLSGRVLDSDEVVVAVQFVNVLNDSNSTNVVSFHAVGDVSDLHLVKALNLVSSDVKFDSVLDFYVLIYELEGSSVVSDKIAYFVWSDKLLLNSA